MLSTIPMLEQPSEEVRLQQIMELYKAGYISKASAKGLANKHAGDLATRVTWHAVTRE